jgi:hypothetical protein
MNLQYLGKICSLFKNNLSALLIQRKSTIERPCILPVHQKNRIRANRQKKKCSKQQTCCYMPIKEGRKGVV